MSENNDNQELTIPASGEVEYNDEEEKVNYACPNCGVNIQESPIYFTEHCDQQAPGTLPSMLRFVDGELVIGLYVECSECGEVHGGTTTFHSHDEEELHTHDD